MKNTTGITKICAHNIEWWYDNSDYPDFEIKSLDGSSEEHITRQLIENYYSGELVSSFEIDGEEVELWGWWKIQK